MSAFADLVAGLRAVGIVDTSDDPGLPAGWPEVLKDLMMTGNPRWLGPSTLVFESVAALQAAVIEGAGTEVTSVVCLGYAAPFDGGDQRLRFSAVPPQGHGLTSADGAHWLPAPGAVSPLQFGARWDGATDDTDAINAAASFARSIGAELRLPAGRAYCAGTLYLGAVAVRGAAGASQELWPGTKTVIRTDGNPMVSTAVDASTPLTFAVTDWQDFFLLAAGGTVEPIELWDRAVYPFQVGFHVGRGHQFVNSTSDDPAEVDGDGVGQVRIRRCGVQRASGWGLRAYKLFGASVVEDCMFRDCGSEAAATEDDDAAGGAVLIESGTVDLRLSRVHAFQASHPTTAWRGRGSGFRLGAAKADTDALGRVWDTGGNVHLISCHAEGFKRPWDIRACKGLFTAANTLNHFSGGEVRIGHPGNPADAITGEMTATRVVKCDVLDVAGPGLRRGLIQNGTPATPISYRHWRGAEVEFSPPGALKMTGIVGDGVTWVPEATPTDHPDLPSLAEGSDRWRPLLLTRSAPATLAGNRLPKFGASGGSLTGWTGADISGDASGTITVEPHYVELNQYQVQYTETLTAGERMTAMVWWRLQGAVGDVGMLNVRLEIYDAAGDVVIARSIGNGPNTKLDYFTAFNFIVPAGGVTRFRLTGGDDTPVRAWTPVLVPGALAPPGDEPPVAWPARGEIVATV